jgi:hypothetical protein
MILEMGYAFGIGLAVIFIIVLVFLWNGPWANKMASVRVKVDSTRRRYPSHREEKKDDMETYFFFMLIAVLSILIFSRYAYGL